MKSLIFTFFLFVSCEHKEEVLTIPPDTIKIFDQVWKKRIYEKPKEHLGSDNAYIYKNLYIVTGDNSSDWDPSIYAYDVFNGNLMWTFKQSGRYQQPGYNIIGKNNILILSDSKGIAAYDLDNKSLLWEHIHSDKNYLGLVGNLPIYGDYVYKNLSYNSFYGPAAICRYDIITGIEEILFEIKIDSLGFSPNLSPPVIWKDIASNEEHLILVNARSKIDVSPSNSPTDLMSFNLNDRKLDWNIVNYCERPTNTLYQPKIFNNQILVAGDWSIYNFDCKNGGFNWRTQFIELGKFGAFTYTEHLLIENRLYVNPNSLPVICLDASNGSILWKNEKGGASCSSKMLYNNDMLIFSSFGNGCVMILDGLTGKTILAEKGERTFYTDVLYHKDTDMYFVQDFASVVGFKINKPK